MRAVTGDSSRSVALFGGMRSCRPVPLLLLALCAGLVGCGGDTRLFPAPEGEDDEAPEAPETPAEVFAEPACAVAADSAMALVDPMRVTHLAVADGPFSAPATWRGGQVPVDGARAQIPEGRTVTVDQDVPARLRTLRVDGTLRFAPDVDTALRVDTLVSTARGQVEIGTEAAPISPEVTARVVFADFGAMDPSCDARQVGRGAVLMGTTRIHGAAKTARAALAEPARAGDMQVRLREAPTGWRPGDRIAVAGTQAGDPQSDEIRVVAAVEADRVRFTEALAREHAAPRPGLDVHVANLTRNVVLASENPARLHRGHLMFMRTLAVDARFVALVDMGRTDKTQPLDDLFFEFPDDALGNGGSAPITFSVSEGPRTNVRGRYPLHFHRGGVDPNGAPALVQGSVVEGSPGWGFVLHSAHAHFVDNVAYGVHGTAFYTEAGDEIGLMRGNIAMRTVNPAFEYDSEGGAIDPDLGFANQEFGNDGDGYWLSGHGVALIDNVSAGATAHGFIVWADGLVEADLPNPARTTVAVATLPPDFAALVPGRDRLPVWWAPWAEVRDNVAYGASIGFRVRYTHSQTYMGDGTTAFHRRPPQAYVDALAPTIDGLTVWNNRDGVLLNYTARMRLRRARIVGIGAPFVFDGGTANTGVGLDLGTEVTEGFGRVEQVSIEGFEMGIVAPRNDQWALSDLTLANATDILITEPRTGPRTLEMTNVRFDPLDGTAVAGRDRVRVRMEAAFDADGYQPYWFVLPDHVTLNGAGLYFEAQAPDFVPLADRAQIELDDAIEQVPDDFIGRTNRELQARFGLSFGGRLMPAAAARDPWIQGGRVGPAPAPARVLPRLFDMTGEGLLPEPATPSPQPELTGNHLRLDPGETVVVLRSNLHTVDGDTSPAELRYTILGLVGGRFVFRDAPGVPVTSFTQAEVDAGVLRFVHDGGAAPRYTARVTDGVSSSERAVQVVLRR